MVQINSNKKYSGFCPECNSFENGNAKTKVTQITVRGITFKATIFELYCNKCGELLTSKEIERINDINIYDIYKEKVGLLTSLQIKDIREKRGWSQKDLALFLDIGEKDITRYENGSIQSKCIDNMIRLVANDEIFNKICICLHKNSGQNKTNIEKSL